MRDSRRGRPPRCAAPARAALPQPAPSLLPSACSLTWSPPPPCHATIPLRRVRRPHRPAWFARCPSTTPPTAAPSRTTWQPRPGTRWWGRPRPAQRPHPAASASMCKLFQCPIASGARSKGGKACAVPLRAGRHRAPLLTSSTHAVTHDHLHPSHTFHLPVRPFPTLHVAPPPPLPSKERKKDLRPLPGVR
jgi:hypothetical protein